MFCIFHILMLAISVLFAGNLGVEIDVQSFIDKVNSRHALLTATESSGEPNARQSVRPYSPTSASCTKSSSVATPPADSLSDTVPALLETAQKLEPEPLMPTPTAEANSKRVSESSMPTPVAEVAPQTESESTEPIPEDVADAAWRVAVQFDKSLPPFTAEQRKGIYESMFFLAVDFVLALSSDRDNSLLLFPSQFP